MKTYLIVLLEAGGTQNNTPTVRHYQTDSFEEAETFCELWGRQFSRTKQQDARAYFFKIVNQNRGIKSPSKEIRLLKKWERILPSE